MQTQEILNQRTRAERKETLECFERILKIYDYKKPCVDCKCPLPEGFVHRCPECYDEMWFPGGSEEPWWFDNVRWLTKKLKNIVKKRIII